MLMQVELEIMLPEEMSVKESHDIALMLQHKVSVFTAKLLRCHGHSFYLGFCVLV